MWGMATWSTGRPLAIPAASLCWLSMADQDPARVRSRGAISIPSAIASFNSINAVAGEAVHMLPTRLRI
jgi:hypothetical protein